MDNYNNYSPGILEMYREQDEQTLEKMYPGGEWRNRYILFLQFELYWPYTYESIEAEIDVTTGLFFKEPTGNPLFDSLPDSYPLPSYKIRTPYPNKDWKSASMRNGRKVSNLGIPILFDTVEKLLEICEVTCRWRVLCEDIDYYCCVRRFLSFEAPVMDHRIYGLKSREFTLSEIVQSPELKKKTLEKYKSFGTVAKKPDGGDIRVMRGSDMEGIFSCEEITQGTFDVRLGENIPDSCAVRPGSIFLYDAFTAHNILRSSDCSHMLLHV